MNTGMIDNWAGDPQYIGAMYPFVGGEIWFFTFLVIFALFWILWEMIAENRSYEAQTATLKQGNLREKIIA